MRKVVLPWFIILIGSLVIGVVFLAMEVTQSGISHTKVAYHGICVPEKLVRGKYGVTLQVNCRGTRGYVRDGFPNHTRLILAFTRGNRAPLTCEVLRDTTADCTPAHPKQKPST